MWSITLMLLITINVECRIMHPDLLQDYRRRVLPCIEHPIREIIDALWELPFVVDTVETCSGHIVTNDFGKSDARYEPIRKGLHWYPHDIRLIIDFSQEQGLEEKVGAFRREVAEIPVDIGLEILRASERGYRTVDGTRTKVLQVFYTSSFPDREDFKPPQTGIDGYIATAQARFVEFWEGFASVLRTYNPEARIGPIAGRDFLQVIDWADLGNPQRHF